MRRFPVLFIILGLISVSGTGRAGSFTNKAFGSEKNEWVFKEALGAYLKGQGYKIDKSGYEMELVDLSGDGKKDALVLLTGPEWCGTGGCTLLVFEGEPGGKARFVSDTTLVTGPITISQETTNGWHELVIRVVGRRGEAGLRRAQI